MGSVVGGFYAMSYSGDSIATITKNANWEELLGGTLSLKNALFSIFIVGWWLYINF